MTNKPQQTEMLYTMRQLADHCGRHVQLVREYFADGILPDPKYTVINPHRKERRFTLHEMDQIKNFFAGVKRGNVQAIRKRAERRKRIENAQQTKS